MNQDELFNIDDSFLNDKKISDIFVYGYKPIIIGNNIGFSIAKSSWHLNEIISPDIIKRDFTDKMKSILNSNETIVMSTDDKDLQDIVSNITKYPVTTIDSILETKKFRYNFN